MERDRYEPMPSRRVQFIKRSGDCNACPIVPAQFFPRLASFFFGLFVSHRDGLDSHMRGNPVPPAPYDRAWMS